jgi:hypothetical protein
VKSESIGAAADIAKQVEHALAWATTVPDSVKATIEDHDGVLSGTVGSWAEKQHAGFTAWVSPASVKSSTAFRCVPTKSLPRINSASQRRAEPVLRSPHSTTTGTEPSCLKTSTQTSQSLFTPEAHSPEC